MTQKKGTIKESCESMKLLFDTHYSEHNFRIVKSPNQAAMTATLLSDKKFDAFKDGDRVDISPDCWSVMDKIARYLSKNGGTGLAIDYGQDYVQGDTLRVSVCFFLEPCQQ